MNYCKRCGIALEGTEDTCRFCVNPTSTNSCSMCIAYAAEIEKYKDMYNQQRIKNVTLQERVAELVIENAEQAAEIERLEKSNGALSATIELRDGAIKQQDAEIERLKEDKKKLLRELSRYEPEGVPFIKVNSHG